MEPVAVPQLEVELWLGVIPSALTPTYAPGGRGDELDEIVVGVGDSGPADLGSISQVQPDALSARDVDVSDLGVVEERLKTSETVDAVEHRGCDHGFGGLVERRPAIGVGVLREMAEVICHELAGQCPLVTRREPATACFLVGYVGCGERLTDTVVQPDDKIGVDPILMPRCRPRHRCGHDTASATGPSSEAPTSSPSAATARTSRDRDSRALDAPPVRNASAASGSSGSSPTTLTPIERSTSALR